MKSKNIFEFDISPDHQLRLDQILSKELPEYSRSRIQKWIKDKRLPKVFAIGPKYFNYAYNPKMILWLENNIKNYDLIIVNGIWEHHN